MKFQLVTKNFKNAVNIVSRLSQKSISLPILNNILLKSDTDLLELAATDLELGVQVWILSKIDKPGQITIPGKALNSLLSLLPEEKIQVNVEGVNISLKGQNFKTKIIGNNADDYPIIPQVKQKFCRVKAQNFLEGLAQVVDFIALNQIKPELAGIYLIFVSNQIIFVASDSFRLAEKKLLEEQKTTEKERSVILPAKAAREIIYALEDNKTEFIDIFLSENQIMFELKNELKGLMNIKITSQLIEGNFPNYQEVIPQKIATKALIDKEELIEKLKSAGLFVGKTNEVSLTFDSEKNQIELHSRNQELGEYESVLSAKIDGEKTKALFNYRFLLEGVVKIKSPKILFELSGPETPALLRSSEPQSDYLYVVMPIKLS